VCRRFAAAISEFSGRIEDPLTPQGLLTLQKSVLGEKALRLGIRQSPVFVGENSFRAQVVHYIAPADSLLSDMLTALQAFELNTRGANPVARAAAVSFAFVYLHPLVDGNGRVHRFLINHLLAADKAIPANLIVPVSATIAGSARGRAGYDAALEQFSGPFMRMYADAWRFGKRRTCPDGVETNFEFSQVEDAQHVWRYPDLTEHVHYLSALLRQTVEHEMADEAQLLRQYDNALVSLKAVLEMPDADADRIIRSLKHENWTISHKLRKELPQLFQEGGRFFDLHQQIIESVRSAFEPTTD
jgi:Fic/DOC family